MCLTELSKFKTNGIGYKIFRRPVEYRLNKKIKALYTPIMYDHKKYYVGKTYKDSHQEVLLIDYWKRMSYDTGFHFYTTLAAARRSKPWSDEVIVKISYSDVTATGLQYGKKVVVARKIKLLEIVK